MIDELIISGLSGVLVIGVVYIASRFMKPTTVTKNEAKKEPLDPLYKNAHNRVLAYGKISTEDLQKEFRIGYARAYVIISSLADNGVTEQPVGVDPEVKLLPQADKNPK
jgi:DNA segregation ATPase FtsK/SpoIIIE-like protein